MRTSTFLLLIGLFFSNHQIFSQNYLKVVDPNDWVAVNSAEPGWHENAEDAEFEEVTIIAEPQGVFTEIEVYATISQGPDAWSWSGEYEIIWQFELPAHTIVHDSWLWVGEDIIKADVVDYWTALQTYEEIVDRNADPSFFYRLPDNRYEIRIYPLFEGETRRIKMSFLVLNTWDEDRVHINLLNRILFSTYHFPSVVNIGMPINDMWQNPHVGNVYINEVSLQDTVEGGTGDLLHYREIDSDIFIPAYGAELVVDAPLSLEKTFMRTYTEGEDNLYQLIYLPEWEEVIPQDVKRSLILLNYDDEKTSISQEELLTQLAIVLDESHSDQDFINVGVQTESGVQLFSEDWWPFDNTLLADVLTTLMESQTSSGLEALLTDGFTWAEAHSDITNIYLLAANEEYFYPPVADDVFLNLESHIPGEVEFKLLDLQDENVSVIFYQNEEYEGNEYFYELITEAFTENQLWEYRNYIFGFNELMTWIFPELQSASGIMDYTASMENGIAYNRHSPGSESAIYESGDAIMEIGKYQGNFPMNISANLLTDDGDFYSISETIGAEDILQGDTLMREMWYGLHLRELESLADSDEDREYIIQKSIDERVLTGLTAFLALEPGEGGEPCISCLYNNGNVIIATEEEFEPSEAKIIITPNPVKDFARIQLIYPGTLIAEDWTATIYDTSGLPIGQLDLVKTDTHLLEWEWSPGKAIAPGMYYCKIQSAYGELTGKVVVIPE